MNRIILYLSIFAFAAGFTACSEDEGRPIELKVSTNEIQLDVYGLEATGESAKFTVSANFAWKAVSAEWIQLSVATGTIGDAEVIVRVGNTFEDREGYITITAADQRRVITVKQSREEAIPSILTVTPTSISVKHDGLLSTDEIPGITLSTNKDWSITGLPSWIKATPSSGVAGDDIAVAIEIEPHYSSDERNTSFTISAGARQEVISVTQAGKPIVPLINENFSWLTYGSAVPYTTGGETAYASWTEAEKAHGWTGTPSNDKEATSGIWIYARPGFIKLGKTDIGGDIISPKLAAIDGTKTIIVSFKAIAYVSESASETGGSYDYNELNIEVLGAGAISQIINYGTDPAPLYRGMRPSSDSQLTPTGAQFWIGTYPSNKNGWPNPTGYNIWNPDHVTRIFKVTGATANTQIRWIGGPKIGDLRTPATYTNRIFLDDIFIVEE